MVTALTALVVAILALNPHLDEGQKLYDQLRYPEAEARLRLAIEVPESTEAERTRAFDLLARALVAQGRLVDATRVYAQLLAKQPHTPTPTDVAPKVRQAFEDAKKRLYPPGHVTLERAAAPPGRIAVDVVDPWKVVRAVVLMEAPAGAATRESPISGLEHHYETALSANVPSRIEVRSDDGRVLARLGSIEAPLLFAPASASVATPEMALATQPQEPTRWPQWVITSAAIAAVVTGVGLAVSSGADSNQAERATAALVMRQLDQRAKDKAIAANVLVGVGVAGGIASAVLFLAW